MTAIRINRFFGEAAGITPRLIPEGWAQEAREVDVSLGSLKPRKDPRLAGIDVGRSNIQTLFKYPNGEWLSWGKDVDVVRSPLADDAWGRIYWTGDGYPKQAAIDTATAGAKPYPNSGTKIGVPAPSSAITFGTMPAVDPPDTALYAAYAYSYVTQYDEEGPLSPATDPVLRWDDGGDIVLNIPAIHAPGVAISKVRLYRSEEGGDYNHLADLTAGQSTYVDGLDSARLGLPAISITWDPPNESMIGLIDIPGNALAGFFDNVLCFCEPGYPHAWPVDYRLTFPDDIVGIAVSTNGIVVCTKGAPWLVVGAVPGAMDRVKIEVPQACVSKRSIVDMGEYVLYASPDGLVAAGAGASLITEKVMSRERWQSLNPSSIHAYRFNDRYIAFFVDDAGTSRSFAFSRERGFEFSDLGATAALYEPYEDQFYTAADGQIWEAEQGAALALRWKSGIYEVQRGTSFTCAKVVADEYPVMLTLFHDGIGDVAMIVNDGHMLRLPVPPSGNAYRELEIGVDSFFEVFSVQVAQSPAELV